MIKALMDIFGVFINKPFEKLYYKTQLRDFWDNLELEKSIGEISAEEYGHRLEIVVHENATDMLERLGSEGMVGLFYTPNTVEKVFAVGDKGDVHIKNFGLSDRNAIIGFHKYRQSYKLQREFENIEKYSIPSSEVDVVFAMIRANIEPENIVKYLEKGVK